ncbi:uncharacterized protein LOC132943645 [Metopolophium dirhodum]|uniref:uncharacterized protein LOC132943645 n=1 Tax=Metopolophium dirhodum TaxID=44670 RepID=UPI0029903C93|nr:uncharacterized protein LOC132943645 [Metopolophium dirhodum]
MTQYLVVEFYEDNSIEAVPANWFKKKEGTCAWPNTKNANALKKCVELKSIPNDVEYSYHLAKVLKISDSLYKARKMVKKGLTNMYISSTDDDVLLKSKRRTDKTAVSNVSTLCPIFSESDDGNCSDENIKDGKIGTIRTLLNGWSPSPKKVKLLKNLQANSTLTKSADGRYASKSSIVKQLSFTDNNTSIHDTSKNKNYMAWNIENDANLTPEIHIEDVIKDDWNKLLAVTSDENAQTFSSFIQMDNDLDICDENAGEDGEDENPEISDQEIEPTEPPVDKPSRADVLAAFDTLVKFSQTSAELDCKFDDQLNSIRKQCLENYEVTFTQKPITDFFKPTLFCGPVVFVLTREYFDQTNLEHDYLDKNLNNKGIETINNEIKSTDLEIADNGSSEVMQRHLAETPQYASNQLQSTRTPEISNSVSVSKETTEFEKEVLHRLSFLKFELKRAVNNQRDMAQRLEIIETRLENIPSYDISNINNNESSSLIDKDFNIPLDNIIDLEIFEEKISGSKEFRTQLVNELSYIGGKHVKAMVKRVMGKLFKDELLKDFSYTGKKGKKKFCSLGCTSVIFDAVKKQNKFKHSSQNEMEDIIKYVLAQAPFNLKRISDKNNFSS